MSNRKQSHQLPYNITDEQIKSALKRSGYLLEQRVEHFLKKQRFHIANENYFVDEQTSVLREIDLIAEKQEVSVVNTKRDFGGIFNYKLVCECENNPQPYVFFLSKAKAPYGEQGLIFSQIPFSFGARQEKALAGRLWGDTPFSNRKVLNAHHLSNMEIATQYCSFSPRDKNRLEDDWIASHLTEQHDTLTNLLKGATFLAERNAIWEENNMEFHYGGYHINLYYPLLILQNRLVVASENEKGEITIEERDHVVFMKNHRTRGSEHMHMIDVIHEKFLPQYVTMIEQEVRRMHPLILKNPFLPDRISNWEKDYQTICANRFVEAQRL